jgi:RecA/RadA recombinase
MFPSAEKINFLDGLNIEKCHNVDDLVYSLQKRIPSICEKMNLKMVIIDSIAGLVRTEFDTQNMGEIMERTRVLFTISTALKWLCDTFNLSILVVNQVCNRNYFIL